MAFSGIAAPLSAGCMKDVCATLGTDLPTLWAVMTVETSGCGFLPDRRPKILFERHKFSEFTEHRFDATHPDISNRKAGGYGESGANQYLRLDRALALDRSAALRATSWGLGQVMGFNATRVGFASPEDMVAKFGESEDHQIRAMGAFIRNAELQGHLQAHRWDKFAAGYNGPGYQANDYDGKLARYHARYATGPLPDPTVRAVQLGLSLLAVPGVPNPGKVDGWYGARTQHALTAFQFARKLTFTGRPDEATMAELGRMLGWPAA